MSERARDQGLLYQSSPAMILYRRLDCCFLLLFIKESSSLALYFSCLFSLSLSLSLWLFLSISLPLSLSLCLSLFDELWKVKWHRQPRNKGGWVEIGLEKCLSHPTLLLSSPLGWRRMNLMKYWWQAERAWFVVEHQRHLMPPLPLLLRLLLLFLALLTVFLKRHMTQVEFVPSIAITDEDGQVLKLVVLKACFLFVCLYFFIN